MQLLAVPEGVRATPGQTKADQCRIKKLEREVSHKEDESLAETTALLVPARKLEAIFEKGEAE